jgi:hypothetical protein
MPDDMREQARKVRMLAEQAKSEEIRAELEAVAQTWEQMAQWAEAVQRVTVDRSESTH